jgi:hypothetical protein
VHLRFILAQLPARVKWNKHAAARLFRLPQSLTGPAKNGKLYLKKAQMEASMKKQFFRILSCCVLLACLCALPAYAQEPKAAQPAAKEDKVVTDITGSADLMRNVVGFTTNFGGPYHFAQADHKSPAQAYGDAPAEGAVAVLRLFARADDHGDVPLNTSGHSFLTITNVSEQDINVGGLLIAPDTSITVSTRGNRCEHSGIWYNLEGYYKYYLNASYYQNLYGIQVSLDQSQLDTVNQALANADHWSAIYNCTSFSAGLWNAVCSDTLCAGVPETPADLKADMLRKYPDKTVFGPTVPYDYIVYYGTSLTPSQEFS